MIRGIFIFVLLFLIFFNNPVYSIQLKRESLENYINKISIKFSRTYCNTIQFGISEEGALAFSIGETIKEFKNNKLNSSIDYYLVKNNIVNNLENKCQIFDFSLVKLDDLKFD